MYYKDEIFWVTQKTMAELFDVNVPAISKHLNNIFADQELELEATVSKMEIVQQEGERQVKRVVDFYNFGCNYSCRLQIKYKKGYSISSMGDKGILCVRPK